MESGTFGIGLLCLSILMIILSEVHSLQKRATMLTRLEAKLDLLLGDAGLRYDPFATLPRGVIEAVRSGDKIRAIKAYREATGAGLREAKEFVETVQRQP
jgi:Ribosomal protein L7/L12 C-terminal domain